MQKKLSITEYAEIRGISRQAAWKAIKKGNAPGVEKWETVGNYMLLYINADWLKKTRKM